MAVEYFLKLDGIEGDATDAKHKGELKLESFSWGLAQTIASARGGGAGAGKPQFQDLAFVQRTGKASTKLFLACATGQHLKSAVLTIRRAGAKGVKTELLLIKLSDVLVSSFQESGAAGEEVLETVTLVYSRLELVSRPQSPGELKAGFDLTTNKKI